MKDSIVKYCCMNPKTCFEIPNTVQSIGWCCFEGAIFLQNVTIPSSITSISFRSFAECVNLNFVYIADSVTTVGDFAFFNCTKLNCGSVKYPISIKEKLISAGVPEIALNKCITSIFSIKHDDCLSLQTVVCGNYILIDQELDDK